MAGRVTIPGYTCAVNEQSVTTQTKTSFIQLTESAAGKVRDLVAEEGRSDIALRVAVQPGGCSGLRYAMYLDDQIGDQDVTDEQFGVRLVVDRMSAPYVSKATSSPAWATATCAEGSGPCSTSSRTRRRNTSSRA